MSLPCLWCVSVHAVISWTFDQGVSCLVPYAYSLQASMQIFLLSMLGIPEKEEKNGLAEDVLGVMFQISLVAHLK